MKAVKARNLNTAPSVMVCECLTKTTEGVECVLGHTPVNGCLYSKDGEVFCHFGKEVASA